jgi:hypothetical protein
MIKIEYLDVLSARIIFSVPEGMRIGQFIWNALAQKGFLSSPEANALFCIEDKELIKILNNYKTYYEEPRKKRRSSTKHNEGAKQKVRGR